MLNEFFLDRNCLERMRSTPFSEYLDKLADRLHSQGYRRSSVQNSVRAASKFLIWLKERNIPLERVDKADLQQFMFETLPTVPDGRRARYWMWNKTHAGAAHLMRILREEFGEIWPSTPAEVSVAAFRDHLRNRCGDSVQTVRNQTKYVREFLTRFFGEGPVDVLHLKGAQILEDMSEYSRLHKSDRVIHFAVALRSYFRFLQFQGLPIAHLQAAVPRVARERRLSARPVLSDEQVRAFLGTFDRSHPLGQRDYGMALCMMDLGMRASDVASLVLEDIDWRHGVIRIPNVKPRHPYPLPLPKRVGQAMADYIRQGRPQTCLREVFLRHQTPIKKLVFGSVGGIIQHACRRAGLPARGYGSRALRRTVATRMHRLGVPLKEIADVLGHQSINTTVRYARFDPAALSKVALTWPEGLR